MHFTVVKKKWWKRLVVGFINILKIVYLQQFKGMQSSKLGMWKGYNLSTEGIQKGNWPFLSKKVYKGQGLSPRCEASRCKTLLSTPPFSPLDAHLGVYVRLGQSDRSLALLGLKSHLNEHNLIPMAFHWEKGKEVGMNHLVWDKNSVDTPRTFSMADILVQSSTSRCCVT